MIYEKNIKIKNSFVINPFFAYSLFWIICLVLYSFSPTKLNESLDIKLMSFLIFSIIVSFIMSHLFKKKYKNKEIVLKTSNRNKGLIIFISILLASLDFIVSGYIPLISILNGKVGSYKDFGIPIFHVIIATMLVFFAIYYGYLFILFKEKKDFLIVIISILYFVLLYSRGTLLFMVICLVCLFFIDKKIKIKHIILLIFMTILGVFAFGIFGNIRSGYKWYDSWEIIHWAEIDVDRNNVLSSIYWVYEYIICSLRNLNYNIIHYKYNNSFTEFISVIFPDFLSKRIFSYDISFKLIIPAFTTGTSYVLPYVTFGMVGVYINFIILVIVTSFICFGKFKNTKYQLISITIMFFLCGLTIFDNMLVYSGYSFTLVYPLILSFFNKN